MPHINSATVIPIIPVGGGGGSDLIISQHNYLSFLLLIKAKFVARMLRLNTFRAIADQLYPKPTSSADMPY